MSAEPIDIVVTDKISPNVRDKLLSIALAALEGADSVDKLVNQLNKVNPSALNKLVTAQDSLDKQLAKTNLSYLAQETALNKAITAETSAATASAKLAEQQNRTAAALTLSQTAAEKLATAQTRNQAASVAASAAAEKAATADAKAATAMIEQARAIQTAADAQERYNALLGVGSGSGKSAKDSASVFVETAAAANKAATAVNAFGETEAQVAKRLQAVSIAGSELSAQQSQIASTATKAVTAETNLSKATRASGDAASDAAAKYSNYMSALNTIGKNSDVAAASQKKVAAAADDVAYANAGVTRELLVLGHEVVSGNFSRIPGSMIVLAERTNGFAGAIETLLAIFTPFRILLVLVTGLLIAYEKLLGQSEDAQRKFNNTLTLTGNIAGLTSETYAELASNISAANKVTISSSKDVISQLAASGQFQQDEVSKFADSAIKLSKLTGQSTDDIVKDFIKAGEAPLEYAAKLAKTTDLISPALLDHIRQLTLVGKESEATRVLSDGLFDSLQQHAPQALTGLARLWNDAKIAVDGYIDSARKAASSVANGPTNEDLLNTAQNKLKDLAEARKQLEALGDNAFTRPLLEANAALTAQAQGAIDNINDVNEQLREQAKIKSDATKATKDLQTAQEQIAKVDEFSKGNVFKLNQELDKYRANLKLIANDPATKSLQSTQDAIDNQGAAEAAIRRKYATPKTPTTASESREAILAKDNAELDKQLRYYGEINDVRIVGQKLDTIDIQLKEHTKDGKLAPLKALDDLERKNIGTKLATEIANKRVEASQDAIYINAVGPLQKFTDANTALDLEQQRGVLTAGQIAEAQRKINYEYEQATNPLANFNKELEQQNSLLASNLTAKERAARTQVNSINNSLAPQGKKLDENQTKTILDQVAAQQHLNEVTAAYDSIVASNEGAYEKFIVQQEALNKALDAGKISTEQYSIATAQLAVQKAQLDFELGNAKFGDIGLASLGKLIEGYKGVLSGLSSAFGSFFTSLEDGFANSIGRAIVYSENLGDALRDVAKSALSELISSLVKIGVQYLINAAIGKEASATTATASVAATTISTAAALEASATTTAASVIEAGIVAEAWATAAALVSLASFGENAIGAAAGILAIEGLTQGLGAFKDGGYTGNVGVSTVAGLVHGQEFVVNAAGTAANRSTLEAMNSGRTVGNSVGTPKITIEDHTTGGVNFTSTAGITPDEIRLIARDEAKSVVTERAPMIVAADLNNPNSVTSKAISRNTNAQRVRS